MWLRLIMPVGLILYLLGWFPAVFATEKGTATNEKKLLELGPGFRMETLQTIDARVEPAAASKGQVLKLVTGVEQQWPGFMLRAPGGHWDISAYESVEVEVKNVGVEAVEVHCRLDSPGRGAEPLMHDGSLRLSPGEGGVLSVALLRRLPSELAKTMFGMRGYPGGYVADRGIDTARVTQLVLYAQPPKTVHAIEISSVRAAGRFVALRMPDDKSKLFPLIDRYGQYIHDDWPGKIKSDDDLRRAMLDEAKHLETHPGPTDWDRWGGWAAGPQLTATGFFRVEKLRGKWWLVDPDGRLFWSHGADCVGAGTDYTPITGRENCFQELPGRDSPPGRFFAHVRGAPLGHYKSLEYDCYSFGRANLLRKFGDDYAARFNEVAHRRLRSWAMNTLGNWSDGGLCAMRKTPYVVSTGSGGRRLEGSEGYWGKFPDVFDSSFAEALEANMRRHQGASADDPWCIGFFIDNELGWGDEHSLAEAALRSPPDQPAKMAFVADLRGKYGSIASLNHVWKTEHASWEALLNCRRAPPRGAAAADLAAFYSRTAEQYFRLCREAVKRVAPRQLYLGCRFAAAPSWANHRAIRAAAKYCDLLSFNPYIRRLADQQLPPDVNLPLLVGEFHFGALDRGMFHPGLVRTVDQTERAAAYKTYVGDALDHPAVIGAHWFQFADQPTTGRSDGENYQIGLVDVCDTPYPELTEAVRETGETMYRRRWEGK